MIYLIILLSLLISTPAWAGNCDNAHLSGPAWTGELPGWMKFVKK